MASPIVKKVLARLEGERELKILESNNEIKQPKLWARAKELAEERHKVYSSDAHGWAIRWYQQKGGIFELGEGKKNGLDGKECWDGYKLDGTKKKGGKTVDNCVKVSEHHQKDADGNVIPHGDGTPSSVEEAATTRIPAQNGNVYELMYSWRGKTYFCKMFFPQPGKPSKQEVQTALNQVYPSAILRNCVISAVNYGDPYIHVGQGDGFTGKATGY